MGITDKFRNRLSLFQSVFLDSSILIYHLEDVKPYSILFYYQASCAAKRAIRSSYSRCYSIQHC